MQETPQQYTARILGYQQGQEPLKDLKRNGKEDRAPHERRTSEDIDDTAGADKMVCS